VANIVDLMALQSQEKHSHGLSDKDFDRIFSPPDKPVIFAYHGYPYMIHRLTYNRVNHDNRHVHGTLPLFRGMLDRHADDSRFMIKDADGQPIQDDRHFTADGEGAPRASYRSARESATEDCVLLARRLAGTGLSLRRLTLSTARSCKRTLDDP
jgi:hypothetical protein